MAVIYLHVRFLIFLSLQSSKKNSFSCRHWCCWYELATWWESYTLPLSKVPDNVTIQENIWFHIFYTGSRDKRPVLPAWWMCYVQLKLLDLIHLSLQRCIKIAYPLRLSCFQVLFHKQIKVMQAQRQISGQEAAPQGSPTPKKMCEFGYRPKGSETLAKIVCGSSSVNIDHYCST